MTDDNTSDQINVIKEVSEFKDTSNKWNVFHYAAYFNSDIILEKLVELLKGMYHMSCSVTLCYANTYTDSQFVNGISKAEGFTALHLAVQGETDNDRLVSVLLQHRHIDVDARDADEWTPLHHACYRGFYRTVVALQNADFCCRNHEGDSPLHLAASNRHFTTFSVLSKCEAFRERYQGNNDFLDLKVCIILLHHVKYSFIHTQDKDGNTLLHLAIDVGNSQLIRWCLDFGFKVHACNNFGTNCLHIAAKRGGYDIAQTILHRGREYEENIVNSRNCDHSTPLYMAAVFGKVEVITLLLDQ